MSGNYDHSKENLGEACGYTHEDAISQRDRLLNIFDSAEGPSHCVEAVEAQFDKKELATLLVGSIIATKRLEEVMELLQTVGGEEAIRRLMKGAREISNAEEIG